MDIKKVIIATMKAQGLNPYKVWQATKGKVSKTAVYTFMTGSGSMTSEQLGHLLDALNIALTIEPSAAAKRKEAK